MTGPCERGAHLRDDRGVIPAQAAEAESTDRARPPGARTSGARAAARRGARHAASGREARREQLRDPSGRIPLAAIARLWRSVASHVQDPTAGLRVGADIHVREFGIVGYAMAFSSTVASALTRVSRYSRILSNAHALIMETAGEATWVRLDMQPELRASGSPWITDSRQSSRRAERSRRRRSLRLIVQLPYRRPPDVKEYVRFFDGPLRVPARLGAALLLRNDDLARPNALADNKLTSYLDRLAEQVLASVGGEGTLRERVRRALWSELSEEYLPCRVSARTLGMSDRTLQRQLREEGTTFAALLTELRREMAPPLLLDGQARRVGGRISPGVRGSERVPARVPSMVRPFAAGVPGRGPALVVAVPAELSPAV